MATTPKRSMKRTLAGTVEGRSPRFLLGSLALAMVISLLAGVAIGIKVEQHRIKTKKPKAVAVTPTTKPKQRANAALAARLPVTGTIFKVGPKSLVVSVGVRKVALVLIPKTRIDLTSPATSSDITVGSRVLVALEKSKATKGTGKSTTSGSTATSAPRALTAKEVIVVGGTSKTRLGTVVTAVTPDSFTFTQPSGKKLTISTLGAKIEKTGGGAKSDLVAGRRVIVKKYLPPARKAAGKKKLTPKQRRLQKALKRTIIALEVIVLPVNNSFG